MSELPKCKLCGADAAMHKVFGGIKYCCSSETCTMHDVLMLKNQWLTLMTRQQAEPVRWMYEDGSVGDIDCGHTCIPLYTAPQAQPAPIPFGWNIEKIAHGYRIDSPDDCHLIVRHIYEAPSHYWENVVFEFCKAITSAQPAPIPTGDCVWQAIEDVLPIKSGLTHSKAVLVWSPHNKCIYAATYNFELARWESWGGFSTVLRDLTHWRLLPPAPTNKDNTDAKNSD